MTSTLSLYGKSAIHISQLLKLLILITFLFGCSLMLMESKYNTYTCVDKTYIWHVLRNVLTIKETKNDKSSTFSQYLSIFKSPTFHKLSPSIADRKRIICVFRPSPVTEERERGNNWSALGGSQWIIVRLTRLTHRPRS